MKLIPLRGKYGIGKLAIVDDDVYEWAKNWKLSIASGKKSNQYIVRAPKRGVRVLLHREVLKAKKGEKVLFINGNYLDCRRENLDYRGNSQPEVDTETGAIKIRLSGKNGRGKYALVDSEDYSRVSYYRWQVDRDGYVIATGHKDGRQFSLKMHRVIMDAPRGIEVDHANNEPLDNRKVNLRLATRLQNGANLTKLRFNTSGYKGVVWDKRNKKWITQIHANNKKIYGKSFTNKLEAAKEYDRLARKHHGEFAKTNF